MSSAAAQANPSNGQTEQIESNPTKDASDISSEELSGPEDGECGDDSPRPRDFQPNPLAKPDQPPIEPPVDPVIPAPEDLSEIESDDDAVLALSAPAVPQQEGEELRDALADIKRESVSPVPLVTKSSKKSKKNKKSKKKKKEAAVAERQYRKVRKFGDNDLGSPVSSDPDLEVDRRPKANNPFVPPVEGSPISSNDEEKLGWRPPKNGFSPPSLAPQDSRGDQSSSIITDEHC